MTSVPQPTVVIDCAVSELTPGVIDATGNVLTPPTFTQPSITQVPLTGDALAQWQADQAANAQALQVAAATAEGAAWVEIRMVRDRWLAQTDYVESFVNTPTSFQHLPANVQAGITADSAGWVAWRQALRDLPQTLLTAGDDPVAVVHAAARLHATTDRFPVPWPQPPSSPVIHLS